MKQVFLNFRAPTNPANEKDKAEAAMMKRRITEFMNRGLREGMDELDKTNAALAKLFIPNLDTAGIPAFKNFREAYNAYSGEYGGIQGFYEPTAVSPGLRACQDFSSMTFAHALENTFNMYLSMVYRNIPFREEIIISQKRKTTDFRQIQSIQVGYLPDLEKVNPETGDYLRMAPYSDTSSLYDISTRGGVIYVTRMHIINDSIELIRGMIERIGRTAKRTHARYAWSFFVNNVNAPDGSPWFSQGHGNLGNVELSISAAIAAVKALANMTEANTGEKIGFNLASANWSLVVPLAKWEAAVHVNQSKTYFSGDDLTTKTANPCYHFFGEKNERIIICPFFERANDWGMIRDKEDVPIIEMSYMDGNEEPQIIVAKDPAQKMVLINDSIGYKVMHEYGGVLADYRGAYKSIL